MNVSLAFRQAAYAQETGRVIIALITISHEDLADDIRISSDPTQELTEFTTDTDKVYGTVSRGQTYLFLPVAITLPNDSEEGPGEMKLQIDNVHRDYMTTIRSIFTPAEVTVELLLDDDLDTVEAQWPAFELCNIEYDATVITGTLKLETYDTEPFPAGTFSPAYFGGLF